jgi:PAS domain-containing protein
MMAGVGNKATDYTEQDVKTVQLIGESIWRLVQRRRTETQLRKLSRIVEQAPLSIVITDLNGAIEYANPAFHAVTGYAPAEVLGQNPRVLKSGRRRRFTATCGRRWFAVKSGRANSTTGRRAVNFTTSWR